MSPNCVKVGVSLQTLTLEVADPRVLPVITESKEVVSGKPYRRGDGITVVYRPRGIERKSWPPEPSTIDIILSWSAEQALDVVADLIVGVLLVRARIIFVNGRKRLIHDGEDALDVLRAAAGDAEEGKK